MLKDKVHGAEILEFRKALAFAGFTHKSPRPITFARIDKLWGDESLPISLPIPKRADDAATGAGPSHEKVERGRSTIRETGTVRGRAISM
jgi:hypothetical protein